MIPLVPRGHNRLESILKGLFHEPAPARRESLDAGRQVQQRDPASVLHVRTKSPAPFAPASR